MEEKRQKENNSDDFSPIKHLKRAIALSLHPSKKRSQQAATKIMTLNLLLTVSYQK
jgi:hypothetical protein